MRYIVDVACKRRRLVDGVDEARRRARELIRDGETGTLFSAGDESSLAEAIVRLLGQSERWPQLREQGRRFVECERHWAKSVGRYREVFGRLQEAR